MRSEIVKYRRPFFVAMGRTREETDKPFVGIVNSQNELVPGHEHLDQIARSVRDGVIAYGGTPFEFPSIGICDGWAEGHAGMRYPASQPGADRRLDRGDDDGPRPGCDGAASATATRSRRR